MSAFYHAMFPCYFSYIAWLPSSKKSVLTQFFQGWVSIVIFWTGALWIVLICYIVKFLFAVKLIFCFWFQQSTQNNLLFSDSFILYADLDNFGTECSAYIKLIFRDVWKFPLTRFFGFQWPNMFNFLTKRIWGFLKQPIPDLVVISEKINSLVFWKVVEQGSKHMTRERIWWFVCRLEALCLYSFRS